MIRRKKKLFVKKTTKKYVWRRRIGAIVVATILLITITNIISSAMSGIRINKVASANPPSEEVTEEIKEPTPKETDIVKGSNVTYEGQKYGMSAEEAQRIANGETIDDKKYVFLTFDDGPSPNTEKVLNILKEKNVKGTFFVLGERLDNDNSKNLLKRAITEGNAIANHTYTHNFKKLYPNNSVNINYFMKELNDTNNLMKNILGENFNTRVMRMPGGYNSRQYYKDSNLAAFNTILNENSIVSIDWNALNGDAEGKSYSPEYMLDYAKRSSEGQNQIVILMHDTYGKEKTTQMLPALIDYYKSQGYEFKTILS